MTTTAQTNAPASTGPQEARGPGFLVGIVIGLVIGLFVGAFGMPLIESRLSSGGPVTNDGAHPSPGRKATPAERNTMPADTAAEPSDSTETKPEAPKPDEKPAAPKPSGGAGQ